MRGKPSARWVCTATPYFTTSPWVRDMTSRMASFSPTPSVRGGSFLMRARIRSMMSAARWPSATTRAGALTRAVRVPGGEPAHAGIGAIDHGAERLIDFMGNRGRQIHVLRLQAVRQRLDFREQVGILNGNGGLVGEHVQPGGSVLVHEALAEHGEHADQFLLEEERVAGEGHEAVLAGPCFVWEAGGGGGV